MAASMYIVVEGEDPGFDIFVNGRSLARHEDALERLALKLGVRPLIEFFSADENSMSLLIEEGAGNQELMRRLPPPQWYSPEDGLRTVKVLLMTLEADPQQLGTGGSMCSRSCLGMPTFWRRTWTVSWVCIWRSTGC